MPLVFTAGALGQHEGTLTLTTNDPYQGNVAVPMVGISGGPVLRCTPDSVAFGEVGVGTPAGARGTCVNAGIVDDTGGSQNLFLEIGTDSSDFSAVFELAAAAGRPLARPRLQGRDRRDILADIGTGRAGKPGHHE